MRVTEGLIKPMYHIGIRELETKRITEKSFTIKIKATNVVINNKQVFLGGEILRFEKDAEKNGYSLIDPKRKSKLIVNLDAKTFSFSHRDKIFNNAESLEKLNPAQKTEFLKLLIIFQQFFSKDSQETATHKEWSERDRATIMEATALDSDNRTGMMADDCYRYNISIGFTKAAATAEAQQDAEAFLQAYPSCSQLGDIDVTCLLEFMPCVATVTFTCTGEICRRGFVTE